MSEHTPGPWHAPLSDGHARSIVWAKEPHGGPVATICVTDPDDTQTANAHLIAAAPDLLEALRAVIEYMPLKPHVNSAYNRAQVAIAKAEGDAE